MRHDPSIITIGMMAVVIIGVIAVAGATHATLRALVTPDSSGALIVLMPMTLGLLVLLGTLVVKLWCRLSDAGFTL